MCSSDLFIISHRVSEARRVNQAIPQHKKKKNRKKAAATATATTATTAASRSQATRRFSSPAGAGSSARGLLLPPMYRPLSPHKHNNNHWAFNYTFVATMGYQPTKNTPFQSSPVSKTDRCVLCCLSAQTDTTHPGRQYITIGMKHFAPEAIGVAAGGLRCQASPSDNVPTIQSILKRITGVLSVYLSVLCLMCVSMYACVASNTTTL